MIDAIVQARMSATRLPGKMLKEVKGKPLIEHVVGRLKELKNINRIIIATTTDKSDDALVNYCQQKNILYYRGEVDNVLNRFIKACEEFQSNKIIRICADNPFLDVKLMDKQLEIFDRDDNADYCTYTTWDGVPIILKPIGLFGEVVTLSALKKVVAEADDPKYYEHVTMFIYKHPELFNIKKIPLEKEINTYYRFTVDYPEDIDFCEEIMEATDDYSLISLIELMEKDKDLQDKNLLFSKEHEKKY